MINDVTAKQPYREDLIELQDSSQSPSPLKRKPLFLPNSPYLCGDKTPAQIRKERLDYLHNQIKNFNITKDLEEIARVLFQLRGDYNETKDSLIMKKSVFTKLVLSRLQM